MVFRPSRWAWLSGTSAVALGVGGLCVYYLLVRYGVSQGDGTRWLLVAFAPMAVLFLMMSCWWGGGRMWEAGQRFAISAGGVARKDLIGGAAMRWSDVKDWALLPGSFPSPPHTLMLVSTDGQRLTIALNLRPTAQLRSVLESSFSAIAAHGGLDRVRYLNEPTPSVWQVCWRRHAGDLVSGYCALVLTLLLAAGAFVMAVDTVNYIRIRKSRATAEAEIIGLKDGDKQDRVRVRYRTPDGAEARLRRPVPDRFSDSHKVGDRVVVEYLPHEPTVGRIRDWDLDE